MKIGYARLDRRAESRPPEKRSEGCRVQNRDRRSGTGTLPTNLADTRILCNGLPPPLLYVSSKQSSAIIPYAVAGRTSVDVQVEYQGARSDGADGTGAAVASRHFQRSDPNQLAGLSIV